MGVSVFAVLEFAERGLYSAFAELYLPRDQTFLSVIAWGDGGITGAMPHPPRGIPADCSSQVRSAFFVGPDEVREYLEMSRTEDDEGEPSLDVYLAAQGEWAVRAYADSGLLPQPEVVSCGWLNLSELRENLAHGGIAEGELTPACQALIAAMERLAGSVGPDNVRLVFWLGV